MNRLLAPTIVSLALVTGCAAPGGGSGTATDATPAAQRMTVGTLTAKGGRQLERDEMQQLLGGATLKGSTQYGTWTSTQNADGTYTGQFSRYAGGGRNFHGNWRIDERGRNCNVDKSRPNQSEICTSYYGLDGKHYATEEANPSSGTVLEDRLVSK